MLKKEHLLLLLLPLYLTLIALFNDPNIVGDESRYLNYATNLTKGYFVDPADPAIRNGPAYPSLLYPFIALDLPLIMPKMLNAFLVFMAILYFYKTLRYYANKNFALIATFILGLYPPMLRYLLRLSYESFSLFLACGFIYYLTSALNFKKSSKKNLLLASILLGVLALTKFIFFYVALAALVVLVILYIIKRHSQLNKGMLVLLLSMVVFSPYLLYTYHITGKPFLTGTGGGEMLYHISTPYKAEFGNWFSTSNILYDNPNETYYDLSQVRENHRKFYQEINHLNPIEKDRAFKSAAIANIKNNPSKFLENIVANIGRFLFHYPFSYRAHSLNTYGFMLPNMFLVVICSLCIYPAIRYFKRIPWSLLVLILIISMYCAALSLIGANGRQFIIVVPFIILFLVFVLNHVITINFRTKHNQLYEST